MIADRAHQVTKAPMWLYVVLRLLGETWTCAHCKNLHMVAYSTLQSESVESKELGVEAASAVVLCLW